MSSKAKPQPRKAPKTPPDNVVSLADARPVALARRLYQRGMAGDVDASIAWLDRYYFDGPLPPQPWDAA